jgi:hypothetical protein
MPECLEDGMSRGFATLVVASIMMMSLPLPPAGAQDDQEWTCSIHVDWDEEWQWTDSGEFRPRILHRYRVSFDPPFLNGSSPGLTNVSVSHNSGGSDITGPNVSTLVAGGEVDIVLGEEPSFGDSIMIDVSTTEADCSRALSITNWNQPVYDHEVTRETHWSLTGTEGDGQGISFDGRGWQRRVGTILESNELGNGTLSLDLTNGTEGPIVDLQLDRIWLNETYDGTELINQDFEMSGSGSLFLLGGEEGATIDAQISDAYVLRTFSEGEVSEKMRFQGDGWISLNGGDNESSGGAFGEVFLFYFETWDEGDFRRLQDIQIEANATARISGIGESFSFDLDELIFREKWEEGIRTDQYLRIYGNGEFDFVASDEYPYIEVNGTIPILHFQSEAGETVADTIVVDGTYDGDAEGSFGLVREIVESGVFENATGVEFEADKIRNEFWFNVSSTPIGPIDEEIEAEHNLTFEYVVPQEDWHNRTIRYTYVEDNGTVEEEYPEASPLIRNAEPPEATPIFADHISRETGLCPQIVLVNDRFSLLGNRAMVLDVTVVGKSIQMVDGHQVSVAEWEGAYGDMSEASGSVINEGILAGLLNEISRTVMIDLAEGNESSISFIENQRIDRITSPSIITLDENTPPSFSNGGQPAVRFREGILTAEGGEAHLEVSVEDVDTDTIGVSADLSGLGSGIIELSDSGLFGDTVIHDGIWTARIEHNGLQHGSIPITITMQDVWVTVEQEATIEVTNPPPRVLEIEFTPDQTVRGEQVGIRLVVYDGHGVSSASVNFQAIGAGQTPLAFSAPHQIQVASAGTDQLYDAEIWTGTFVVPTGMAPGKQRVPIIIEDADGASSSTTMTGGVKASENLKAANQLQIDNQSPRISNLTILWGQTTVDVIASPTSGDPINYSLEVTVEDFDGVSSVQAKIGRLAPIGQSETWMLLKDDGTGPDRVAGDEVFSLQFSARSSLWEGDTVIMIRATDIYLSMTPTNEQSHNVTIVKASSTGPGSSWIADNSIELVLVSMGTLLLLGIGAFVYIVRNSELE